jgi:Rrf2 family transcriptional regulator, iron-sulfur cluster assembly transcription factor
MLFSKSCEYAIRAAVLVASREAKETRKYIPVRELAAELSISFHFLTKIFQSLTEARVMQSFRGPSGGVGLARPAGHIRLIDIVSAIDGTDKLMGCVLGLPGCTESRPCPLHSQWGVRRDHIREMLEQTTLFDLSHEEPRKKRAKAVPARTKQSSGI